MKKSFLTMLVVFFATTVFGPNLTQGQKLPVPVPTRTEINRPFTELPQCIKNWVKQDNDSIWQAYKFLGSSNGVVFYELEVSKLSTQTIGTKKVKNQQAQQWLQFTSDCRTVKKILSLDPGTYLTITK